MKSKLGILAGLAVVVYLGSRLWAQTPLQPAQPAPTRIGLLNMVEVIKNYKKAQNMDAELRHLQADWESKLKPFRDQMIALQTKGRDPSLGTEQREQLEKDVRKLQLDFKGMEEDAKKDLMKRAGQVYEQLYHEVEDAVNRFAGSNGYAVVFFYNDDVSPDEKYAPLNVTRKFSLPAAAMPIYIASQVDLTATISNNLNALYQQAAATGSVPGGLAPNR